MQTYICIIFFIHAVFSCECIILLHIASYILGRFKLQYVHTYKSFVNYHCASCYPFFSSFFLRIIIAQVVIPSWPCVIKAYRPRLFGLYCEMSDFCFLVWTERRRREVHAKSRGLIFHSTDRTSEVNKPLLHKAMTSCISYVVYYA